MWARLLCMFLRGTRTNLYSQSADVAIIRRSRYKYIEEAIARQEVGYIFYEANIPFNVVRHPAFLDAVKSTSELRVPYKLPSYHAMRTKLLKFAREEVAKMVNEKTKDPIYKYGVTICSDGWDNVTH